MIFNSLATIFLFATAVAGLPANHEHPNPRSSETTASSAISGCGSASAWHFDADNHANVTVDDRSFLVHIPSAYDANTPHAVVVSFHGFKQDDSNQETITGLSEKGLRLNGKGIIAVYPNAQYGPGKDGDESLRAWQGAPYSPPGVDDIAFTQEVVQQLQLNLCVDSTRIYASGKSNGGGFTNLLACTPSTANIFAAFAPVSAALYSGSIPENCNPGRVVPIINFHGLADNIIPFNGRKADKQGRTEYATPNITQYREAWAIRNCHLPKINAVVSHPHKDTTLSQYMCSASNNDAAVSGFSVKGLGHSWPSTLGLDGDVTDFNATTADILPFFDMHTLM